jgi:hypothetical protein
MENNEYQRYLAHIRHVRSPIAEDHLNLLLQRSGRRKLFLWLPRLTELVALFSMNTSQLNAPDRDEVNTIKCIETVDARSTPPAADSHIALQPVAIKVAHEVEVREVTDIPNESDQDTSVVITHAETADAAIVLPLRSTHDTRMVVGAADLAAARNVPLIFSVTKDILQLSSTELRMEYRLFDRLAVGVSGGIQSRTVIAPVATVDFHDTTVSANGGQYISRIGELIPQPRSVVAGIVGGSVRLFAKPMESEWNVSFGVDELYSSGFSTRLELGTRYEVLPTWWLEAGLALGDAFRADRSVTSRMGVAWQW